MSVVVRSGPATHTSADAARISATSVIVLRRFDAGRRLRAYDPTGTGHRGRALGDVNRDDGVGADPRVIIDLDIAANVAASADAYPVPDRGRPQETRAVPIRLDLHALEDPAVISHRDVRSDDDASLMADAEAPAKLGGKMDRDAEPIPHDASERIEQQSGESRKGPGGIAMDLTPEPVDRQSLESRPRQFTPMVVQILPDQGEDTGFHIFGALCVARHNQTIHRQGPGDGLDVRGWMLSREGRPDMRASENW